MFHSRLLHRATLTIFGAFFLMGLILMAFNAVSLSAQEEQEEQEDEITSKDSTAEIDSLDKDAFTFRPIVYTLTIDGAIGVVTDERIGEAIETATKDKAELLVIMLDTPGGFMSATSTINKRILNSPVPVCMYVFPSGARAGSAGVYMTYAAHFAAMAPSTNIGSAHPVSGGGEEIDSVMNEKVTNDAVAGIKAAAEKRGRNVEWAEKAVRESVNITNNEALELNVINFIAKDLDDLLSQIDGKEIETTDGLRTVRVKDAIVNSIDISFMQRLRALITDPSIVFILMSLGGLGIMLELYNPGAIFPGVIGAICLILSFYASQTLPINYAGVALIFLAVGLFVAEIKVISHGLLTIGGVVSLMLGGMLLIDDPAPAVQVSKIILFSTGAMALIVVGLLVFLVAKTAKRQVFIGNEGMIGKTAIVKKTGYVYVNGALWKAECEQSLDEGDKVEIIAVESLLLKVKKLNS